MIQRSSLLLAALFAMLLLNVAVATNQPVPWNPPCPSTRIVNLTGCDANLVMETNIPSQVSFFVPAGTTITVPTPIPGILSVRSQLNANLPVIIPGVMPPPVPPLFPPLSAPANAWVRGVRLGPNGCCFDVYFYSSNDPNYPCHIFLYPGTPPCTP